MITPLQMQKIKDYSKKMRWTINEGYWNHTTEVVKHSINLQKKFGGKKDIIEAAAWLHDIGKNKGRNKLEDMSKEKHQIVSSEMADKFMKEINISDEEIRKVCDAILQSHSTNDYPANKEQSIIACADKMAVLTDNDEARRWHGKNLSKEDKLLITNTLKDIFLHIKNSPFPSAAEYVQEQYVKKLEKYKA
ncbi:HD domain protein [Candidatus Tiddalikarchaeum anstoanum]|nr:HD domain protein [Candidatus Tiddalikarchaeum anstoanum]